MNPHSPEEYATFSTQDFVLDEFFQRWIIEPDELTDSFWKAWLRQYPEKQREISEARSIVSALSFNDHSLSDKEIAGIWERIQQPESVSSVDGESRRTLLLKIAASLLVGAVLLYSFITISSSDYLEYHTAYGETKTVVLPDSSTVILNSNSTLRFKVDKKNENAREVWLDGEAFFSVTHKVNNQIFRVNTGEGMSVEVLGTTFDVFHRKEETKVVLNTGKIRLRLPPSSAADNIIMAPGEFIEYKQKSFSKRQVDPAVYSAWTERKIILDHTSLREMVDMLKNNYGIDVYVSNDSLLNQTVSGSMPITNPETLVRQIAQAFELKIQKQNNKILMHE